MNDPSADVLAAVNRACKAHPTQRVGQVIANALAGQDPFYLSDEDVIGLFEAYAAGIYPPPT